MPVARDDLTAPLPWAWAEGSGYAEDGLSVYYFSRLSKDVEIVEKVARTHCRGRSYRCRAKSLRR